MKRSTGLKIGSLAALALASWLCTSILAGAGRREAPAARDEPAIVFTKHRVPPGQDIPTPDVAPGQVIRGADALFGMERCEMTPGPGRLAIEAQAAIWDSRPGPSPYMWSIEIRAEKPDGRIVLDHDYDDQVFSVPVGETGRPAFRGAWPLPPGDYFVQLKLSTIANRPLPGGAFERPQLLCSGGGPITIPGP